jgi:hypothetical protein
LIREIEEFPQHPIVHPHIDYVNTLYVYPISVNFSKWSGASSARNIGEDYFFFSFSLHMISYSSSSSSSSS